MEERRMGQGIGMRYETKTEIRSVTQLKVNIYDLNMTLKTRPSWTFSKVANRKLIVSIRSSESIRIDSANESIRIANRPAPKVERQIFILG